MPADDELELYIRNDGKLYRERVKPLHDRLVAQKARGAGSPGVRYDSGEAFKDFEAIVREGARRYAREFPGSPAFSAAEKKAAAKGLLEYFETEYRLGNFKTAAELERDIAAARSRRR